MPAQSSLHRTNNEVVIHVFQEHGIPVTLTNYFRGTPWRGLPPPDGQLPPLPRDWPSFVFRILRNSRTRLRGTSPLVRTCFPLTDEQEQNRMYRSCAIDATYIVANAISWTDYLTIEVEDALLLWLSLMRIAALERRVPEFPLFHESNTNEHTSGFWIRLSRLLLQANELMAAKVLCSVPALVFTSGMEGMGPGVFGSPGQGVRNHDPTYYCCPNRCCWLIPPWADATFCQGLAQLGVRRCYRPLQLMPAPSGESAMHGCLAGCCVITRVADGTLIFNTNRGPGGGNGQLCRERLQNINYIGGLTIHQQVQTPSFVNQPAQRRPDRNQFAPNQSSGDRASRRRFRNPRNRSMRQNSEQNNSSTSS